MVHTGVVEEALRAKLKVLLIMLMMFSNLYRYKLMDSGIRLAVVLVVSSKGLFQTNWPRLTPQ